MSTNKATKLNELISQQETLLKEIRDEARELDSDSLLSQNEKLTGELRAASEKNQSLETENAELKSQLAATKSALFAKLADEKLMVFSATQRRIENIYYKEADGVTNRLLQYEDGCRKSIRQTMAAIENYGTAEYSDLQNKLAALNNEFEARRRQINEYQTQQYNAAVTTNRAIGKTLEAEPLTENEKRVAQQQKSLESFIGLNLLSKAGIFLFIIGIIMLGRFAYVHMSDIFKCSLIFLLGAVLIAIGEVFHKKEKSVFSTALISGGTAVLYAATATGYFAFDLYSVRITFILCIVVTAVAIFLSNQIKSQVICAFGAVGGYLPVVAAYMVSFGNPAAADKAYLPVVSGYFCLLSIVIFIMTYNKKWYAAQFIGYGLHLVAIGGVSGFAWTVRNLPGYGFALPVAAAFSIASFIIYLLMPSSKIVTGKVLTLGDTVLLGLNTVSGAISISISLNNCFEEAKSNSVIGFVFLALSVFYGLLMAFSIREKNNSSKAATAITSVSALIFSMWVVPLIFGLEYAAIAWAAEGLILALIGIEKKIKVSENAGLFCMLLSLPVYVFEVHDIDNGYSVLSIISLGIITAAFWTYVIRGLLDAKDSRYVNALYIGFEIATSILTVIYGCYLYSCLVHGPLITVYSEFTNVAVGIVLTVCMALLLRFGILKNDVSVVFSDLAAIAVTVVTFSLADCAYKYNEFTNYFHDAVKSPAFSVFNLILLIAINIGVELFFAAAVSDVINRSKAPVWVYTAAISISSLMLITATIMAQFDVKFSSIIISAVYIAAACILLFIGFRKRFTVVRSGGLVLVLIAFAKLCFVDTTSLHSAWKIVSYFAFGAILILISYFYHRFSKSLEKEISENKEDFLN